MKTLLLLSVLGLTGCTPLTSFLTGGLTGSKPSSTGVAVNTHLGIQKGDNAYDGKLLGTSLKFGDALGPVSGKDQSNYAATTLTINNKHSSLWVWIIGFILGALVCFGFWFLPRPNLKKVKEWVASLFFKMSKKDDEKDMSWSMKKGYQPKNSILPEIKPGQKIVPDRETKEALRQVQENCKS